MQQNIIDSLALPASRLFILAGVSLVRISTVIVFLGIFQLLFSLYTRPLIYGLIGFVFYFFSIAFLLRLGWVELPFMVNHIWMIALLFLVVTVFLFWSVLKDRVLTPIQAGVVLLVWLVFVIGYFYLLRGHALLDTEASALFIAWKFALSLLPLTAVVLAPWTLSLFRHR